MNRQRIGTKLKTVLITTDQPFWRRENGAHQRTYSLVQFLRNHSFDLSVFYLVEMTEKDVAICNDMDLRIVCFDPNPTMLFDMVSPIIGAAKKLLRGVSDTADKTENPADFKPLNLDSFRWPLANRQFENLVRAMKPDFVWSVYVVWATLLDAFPRGRRNFKAIVDTHDLLHVRQQQFADNGKIHWIDVTKEDETVALEAFDMIIATQNHEANAIRTLVPKIEVVVVGHCPESGSIRHRFKEISDHPRNIRVGFLGSNNAANVDGIGWFIQECWDQVHRETDAKLLVAGAVEQGLRAAGLSENPGMELLGVVHPIEDFYNQVDFVINPVRFGSGIKIKTIEAFRFGKPIVVHSHSTLGLSPAALECVDVADDPDEFRSACIRLIGNDDWRSEATDRAVQIGKTEFTSEFVFSDLHAWLQDH